MIRLTPSLKTLRYQFKTHAGASSRFSLRSFSSQDNDEAASSSQKTALVLGSSGALGSSTARYLSKDLNVNVIGADVTELPNDFTGDWELDGFVNLPMNASLTNLTTRLVRGVHFLLHGQAKLDAIIVASGGWEGDPEENVPRLEEKLVEQGAVEYVQSIERMRLKNLDPVIAASYIARHYMKPEALFVVTGAAAALNPTPTMMGYGVAKTAAHHIVKTMGACTGKSMDSKSVRKAGKKVRLDIPAFDSMTVVAILPSTIDTAANRRGRPSEDFSQWTKPADIAKEIGQWLEHPSLRPHSGSLVKVHPKKEGKGAVFELVR